MAKTLLCLVLRKRFPCTSLSHYQILAHQLWSVFVTVKKLTGGLNDIAYDRVMFRCYYGDCIRGTEFLVVLHPCKRALEDIWNRKSCYPRNKPLPFMSLRFCHWYNRNRLTRALFLLTAHFVWWINESGFSMLSVALQVLFAESWASIVSGSYLSYFSIEFS